MPVGGGPAHASDGLCLWRPGNIKVARYQNEIATEMIVANMAGFDALIGCWGQSRINGGLHYRFDLLAGQVLGRRVAEHVLATDVSRHEAIPLG
jgi:hypothetical protein